MADVWVALDADLVNAEELLRSAPAGSGLLGALAHLYQVEGAAFVRRLRGGFALALWDRRRRSLLLAVDHFGLRRLHYSTEGRTTAFASRVSAARATAGRAPRVDQSAVYQYLNFGFVPAPETAFAGVRRVPPGYMLSVGAGHTKLEPFWDMTYVEARQREERAASAMYRLTHQAIAESLKGIAPKDAGAFLSGGTDSSTVVGLMARITGESVNAFSIGFNEDQYNELRYAELAARHFGAAHYTRVVTADEALDALPRLVEAYDEPFGNNSVLATFFCAQLARESRGLRAAGRGRGRRDLRRQRAVSHRPDLRDLRAGAGGAASRPPRARPARPAGRARAARPRPAVHPAGADRESAPLLLVRVPRGPARGRAARA